MRLSKRSQNALSFFGSDQNNHSKGCCRFVARRSIRGLLQRLATEVASAEIAIRLVDLQPAPMAMIFRGGASSARARVLPGTQLRQVRTSTTVTALRRPTAEQGCSSAMHAALLARSRFPRSTLGCTQSAFFQILAISEASKRAAARESPVGFPQQTVAYSLGSPSIPGSLCAS